jgi:energy-coupling factor transport system ATP-binding protein
MIPITLSHVSFSYPSGLVALRDISLSIAPGETVALIGQNGAGKTTLARQLNGLLQPTSGTVLIGDWETRTHTVAQLARRVGYVFQHPEHQLFKRTVRDEVFFGPRNLGFAPDRVQELAEAALAATQLDSLADSHPHDLMPALRKRVALASVLAMDTPILVLDEPTMGQDAAGLALIGSILAQLKAAGRTVIMISHDIDFCAETCERLIVLGGGVALLDGPPAVVFNRPDLLAQTAVELPQLARLAEQLRLPLAWQAAPLLDELAVRAGRARR